MGRLSTVAIALVAASLLVPWAAQAESRDDSPRSFRFQLVLPVEFGSFGDCADAARYQVTSQSQVGHGRTCLLTAPDFSPCNEGIGFCRDLATQTVLKLPRGAIRFDANQHEVVTAFDPDTFAFSVDITWTGSVTGASHKYHKFIGATVSGGGSTAFDANGVQTGDLAFVIGEPDLITGH
jgi:hypothetical protein